MLSKALEELKRQFSKSLGQLELEAQGYQSTAPKDLLEYVKYKRDLSGLTYKEFKEKFAHLIPKGNLKRLWEEYKENDLQPTRELVDYIKENKEKIDELRNVVGKEIDNLNQSQIDFLARIYNDKGFIPNGVIKTINEIPTKYPPSSLPYETYLSMFLLDCDKEIEDFLREYGLYRDFITFANNFNEGKYSLNGYKTAIEYIRSKLNIEEPDRCEIYQFSPEKVKKVLETRDNYDALDFIKKIGWEDELDEWVNMNWPPNAPDEMDLDSWMNMVRELLGVDKIGEILSREERKIREIEERVEDAVNYLKQLDPNYNPEEGPYRSNLSKTTMKELIGLLENNEIEEDEGDEE